MTCSLKTKGTKLWGAAESFTPACMQGVGGCFKAFISTGLKKKKTQTRWTGGMVSSHIHTACVVLQCCLSAHPGHDGPSTVHCCGGSGGWEVGGDSQLPPGVCSLHHQPQTHNKSSPRSTKPTVLLDFFTICKLEQQILTYNSMYEN